jgi:hypothetical protein
MNIADPKYLEHLRDLPTGYLLDLLADNEDADEESIIWVLQERGMSRDETTLRVERRINSRWTRPYNIWKAVRWITLLNAIIVTYFNISGLSKIIRSDHAFKEPMLFLSIGCIAFGFFVGFKLTTYVYLGEKNRLHCGFPIPVGLVDLETGDEILKSKAAMNIGMAINAIVGISLTHFPLVFLYTIMD